MGVERFAGATGKKRYYVIIYDLFGRGYSGRPKATYNLEFYSQQLHDLLEALGVQAPVRLVGLAFGSLIACDFTTRHSNRVGALAFLTSDGFGVSLSFAAKLILIPFIGDYLFTLIGRKSLMGRLPSYSQDRTIVAWLQQHYATDLNRKGFRRALLSSLRNVQVQDEQKLFARFAATHKPVLIIWGSKDEVTPLPRDALLKKTLPGNVCVTMPGVGHLPHVEAPAEVSASLANFFAGHEH